MELIHKFCKKKVDSHPKLSLPTTVKSSRGMHVLRSINLINCSPTQYLTKYTDGSCFVV